MAAVNSRTFGQTAALTLSALLTLTSSLAVAADADAGQVPSTLSRGWSALRQFDCARCHGRDWDGWSAPNLIAAVRDGSRERFEHYLLVGEISRGMPGYQSQPALVAEIDSIYAYLRARADGSMGAGNPGRENQKAANSQ
jgi:mono/diheme cytochrome c family protein